MPREFFGMAWKRCNRRWGRSVMLDMAINVQGAVSMVIRDMEGDLVKDAEQPTTFRPEEAACSALQRTGGDSPLARLKCSLARWRSAGSGEEPRHLFGLQPPYWSTS